MWGGGSVDVAVAVAAGVAVAVGVGVVKGAETRAEFRSRVAVFMSEGWSFPFFPDPNRISAATRASNVNPTIPSASACWRSAPLTACNGALAVRGGVCEIDQGADSVTGGP